MRENRIKHHELDALLLDWKHRHSPTPQEVLQVRQSLTLSPEFEVQKCQIAWWHQLFQSMELARKHAQNAHANSMSTLWNASP